MSKPYNIGADDHESHFVFDILFNNSSDILPGVHSTDTHGTNEVNFAILDCFGYQFAPRYKDIFKTVTNGLYGFTLQVGGATVAQGTIQISC